MLFNLESSAILGKGMRLGAFGLRTELGHWVEIAEKVFADQYAKKVGDEFDLKREWATIESSEFQLSHPCLAPGDTIFVEGIDVFLECSGGRYTRIERGCQQSYVYKELSLVANKRH